MLPPLADHPDFGKLPLERMAFDVGGRPWDMDVVRDEAAQMGITADRDQFPFGLMIWESSLVLARELETRRAALQSLPVLELGCGVGLPGLVAQAVGAKVVQTDHDGLALALCRHNAALNKVDGIQQFVGDWHHWTHGTRYPLVVGADIIYDTADYAVLERLFRACLAPGGEVLLTDPSRQQTIALFTVMEDAGWAISTRHTTLPALVGASGPGTVTVQTVSARLS